jgi:hypothetical protein
MPRKTQAYEAREKYTKTIRGTVDQYTEGLITFSELVYKIHNDTSKVLDLAALDNEVEKAQLKVHEAALKYLGK